MCQQIGYTDHLFVFSVFALPVLEAGDVAAHRVEQAYFSAFCQNHGAYGCGYGLAAGCHIENGIYGHRFRVRINPFVAVCLQIGHFTVTYHCKYGAGNLFAGDGRFNGFIGIHQFAGIQSRLFGSYPLQRLCGGCLQTEQKYKDTGKCFHILFAISGFSDRRTGNINSAEDAACGKAESVLPFFCSSV